MFYMYTNIRPRFKKRSGKREKKITKKWESENFKNQNKKTKISFYWNRIFMFKDNVRICREYNME